MELASVLVIYIILFVLGIIGLPFASMIFSKWSDGGYGVSKIIGLLIVGVTIWLLSSLQILSFSETNVVFVFLFFLGVSFLLIYKAKIKIKKSYIYIELITFVFLFVLAFIRSFNPQIEGTEKLMNIGIINSILRTDFFPPNDIWLSGEKINYYYMGHYFIAFLSKLSTLPSYITYNLGIGVIFTLSFSALNTLFLQLFSKAKRGVKYISAFMGASFIMLSGNLHYFIFVISSILTGSNSQYFYAYSTRLIPYTINEFPAYSFILGDLHGHYVNLPFFILALVFLYLVFVTPIKSINRKIFTALLSLILWINYTVNSWDFITIMFLFLSLTVVQLFLSKSNFRAATVFFVKTLLLIVVPGLLVILPFILNFKPPIGGLGFVPLDTKSPPIDFLTIWGGFLIIFFIFTAGVFKKFVKIKENFGIFLFALFFAVSGLFIIAGVEFLFIKDIFFYSNYNYFRANTVFKFYYASWILWGIAASIFTYLTVVEHKVITRLNLLITKIILLFIFIILTIYSLRGIRDYYPVNFSIATTLSGIDYIKNNYAGDYYAIKFINENIKGTPVILEAVGEAYTYFARISAYTGLPTVIGWPTHEWQWRNNSAIPFARKSEVEKAYNSNNILDLKEFLKKYKVEYIYIGQKEFDTYKNIDISLFKDNFLEIYNNLNTHIFKLPIAFD